MWRGYNLGGPGFQAWVTGELFGNESHALEVEAWGYTDFEVFAKEIDLSLSYSFLNRNARCFFTFTFCQAVSTVRPATIF
jgi:hypothetical protein